MAKDKKAQVGCGKAYKYISSAPIEGASIVPVSDNGYREGFRENHTTFTLAKDPDFGPGIAGGSGERYYEIRRKQMQRRDWGRPADANEDELPASEKHDAREQSYEDAKDVNRHRGENLPKTKAQKDY